MAWVQAAAGREQQAHPRNHASGVQWNTNLSNLTRHARPGLSQGLRLFADWWLQGLLEWVPMRWRRLFAAGGRRSAFVFDDGTRLSLRFDADESPDEDIILEADTATNTDTNREQGAEILARLRGRHVILCLSENLVLCRDVVLPSATEENLREVLGFEMDRYTPFSADSVDYAFRVSGRIPEQEQIQVRVCVLRSDMLDQRLENLARRGIRPEAVQVELDANEALPLRRIDTAGKRGARLRYVNLGLAMLMLALLGLSVWLPIERLRVAAGQLYQQTYLAEQQADKVLRLRTRLEGMQETSRAVQDMKRSSRPTIDVLNELTRIIPDNTWVSQLTIKKGKVELRGESKEASALIRIIENSPLFEGAKFSQAVTPNRRTGMERFRVSADIVKPEAS